MMVKQETMEQLVGMLSESLTLCREKEKELGFARNRIDGLRQDVVVRDGELKALRDARAQERTADVDKDVGRAHDLMLAKVHAVLDDVGVDPGPAPERLDRMRDVVRQLCHDKSTLRERVAGLGKQNDTFTGMVEDQAAKVGDLEKHAALLKETLRERDEAMDRTRQELKDVTSDRGYWRSQAQSAVARAAELEVELKDVLHRLQVRKDTVAEAHGILDDMGATHCDAEDRERAMLDRLKEAQGLLDEALEEVRAAQGDKVGPGRADDARVGYDDLDGPDVAEPTHEWAVDADAAGPDRAEVRDA